jgi:hypothetical protein
LSVTQEENKDPKRYAGAGAGTQGLRTTDLAEGQLLQKCQTIRAGVRMLIKLQGMQVVPPGV